MNLHCVDNLCWRSSLWKPWDGRKLHVRQNHEERISTRREPRPVPASVVGRCRTTLGHSGKTGQITEVLFEKLSFKYVIGLHLYSQSKSCKGRSSRSWVNDGFLIFENADIFKTQPYILCCVLIQPCTDFCLSVAFWLTRRLVLYYRPNLKPLRGDKILILVPSDC